jgi:hypothetical protein
LTQLLSHNYMIPKWTRSFGASSRFAFGSTFEKVEK